MNYRRTVYIVCFLLTGLSWSKTWAQVTEDEFPVNSNQRFDPRGRPIKKSDTADQKLQHRDPLEDSITISYHYFDLTRNYKLDSSISDFYLRYPVSNLYYDLGNYGNPVKPVIFSPYMKAGFDPGFHAYDAYKLTPENTKIYNTTRPYTELAYMIGSKSEQYIDVVHTQNRKNNVNIGFEYRLINAPGAFKNSNTSNNNIRVSLTYVSKNKRYALTLLNLSNSMKSSDNGGVQDDKSTNGLNFNDPFVVPVRLGNASSFSRNFFSTTINTGTVYKSNEFILRQNYDLGQSDSLVVADTITYRLFYPRIRFQYTIDYKKDDYTFKDVYPVDSLYRNYYNYIVGNKEFSYRDLWYKLTNDFSIISFPEKNNPNQFLKLGTGYEIISGGYYPYVKKYNNIYFAGEYRNRTRNKKWDAQLAGKLYGAGDYAGDYEASISLERLLNKNSGSMFAGFQNVNRSAAAVFNNSVSAFPVITDGSFNKQNISRIFANLNFSKLDLTLTGDYYIVGNYIYLDDFFKAHQQSALFNLLHVAADKKIKLARHWNWYIEVHMQQLAGDAPVNVPLFFTRNRFAFEGNFFKNLFLSTGIEVRYNSQFNPDNYSPFNGQFMYQDTFSTRNNRPDVNAFLNIRIKSFKGFLRVENLNAFNPGDQYRFTYYNYYAPHYPQRPFWFRFGFWWSFVN